MSVDTRSVNADTPGGVSLQAYRKGVPDQKARTLSCAGFGILETKTPTAGAVGLCWRYLSSRAVTRQVLSALMSLTSVFGMGTGGPSSQSTRTFFSSRSHQIKAQLRGFDLEATNHDIVEVSRLRDTKPDIMYEELVTHTGFEPMLTA